MRDWVTTDKADQELLREVKRCGGQGAWRPWRGSYARSRRLQKDGLLTKAGVSAMPPHVLYTITTKGEEELEVASRLEQARKEG